jgi:hypothetical protein
MEDLIIEKDMGSAQAAISIPVVIEQKTKLYLLKTHFRMI